MANDISIQKDWYSRYPARTIEIIEYIDAARHIFESMICYDKENKYYIRSASGNIAFNLKRFLECFEDDSGALDVPALIQFLERNNVHPHGNDQHLFARVVRLLESDYNSNLRSKIGNILAGIYILNVKSDDLPQKYRDGIDIDGKGSLHIGPYAFEKAYHYYIKNLEALDTIGLQSVIFVEKPNRHPKSEKFEAVELGEKLSKSINDKKFDLTFQDQKGKMIRIKRVESSAGKIVLYEE